MFTDRRPDLNCYNIRVDECDENTGARAHAIHQCKSIRGLPVIGAYYHCRFDNNLITTIVSGIISEIKKPKLQNLQKFLNFC